MGRQLGDLLDTLRQQQRLLSQVRAQLPAPLDAHCLAAQCSKHRLVLYSDSSIWANRLRFELPALLERLRQQGMELDDWQIRIQPPPRKAVGRDQPRLSTAASRQLDQLAEHIDNSELSQALQRLARRGRGQD